MYYHKMTKDTFTASKVYEINFLKFSRKNFKHKMTSIFQKNEKRFSAFSNILSLSTTLKNFSDMLFSTKLQAAFVQNSSDTKYS